MQQQEKRARAVRATIAFLETTPLAADAYEQQLLHRFVKGELTITQVLELLEMRKIDQALTPTPHT